MPELYTREREGSRRVGARRARLAEAVRAGAEKLKKIKVAEDLELLADFVADVGVFGVKLRQGVRVRVYVGEKGALPARLVLVHQMLTKSGQSLEQWAYEALEDQFGKEQIHFDSCLSKGDVFTCPLIGVAAENETDTLREPGRAR